MLWPEMRRFGQQDNIDSAVDYLLISIKADETPIFTNIDFRIDGFIFFKLGQTGLQTIGKGVSHGHKLDVLICV